MNGSEIAKVVFAYVVKGVKIVKWVSIGVVIGAVGIKAMEISNERMRKTNEILEKHNSDMKNIAEGE